MIQCAQCGTDISKFYAKAYMGVCNNCHKMYCKNCYPNLKKKCPSCGQKMQITKRTKDTPEHWKTFPCQSCGTRLQIGKRFCDNCGQPTSGSTESSSDGNESTICILMLIAAIIVIYVLFIL